MSGRVRILQVKESPCSGLFGNPLFRFYFFNDYRYPWTVYDGGDE